MVQATKTEYFLLLDDDHLFDADTDLSLLVHALRKQTDAKRWDIVGMRVRNLPGIAELEDANIFIPRYIANITSFKNRQLTLCVWNENIGPSIHAMRVPLRVDVLHNALAGRTEILKKFGWRNELKVNEHMSFFLDAWKKGLRVGYLPSVYVHHRERRKSVCYGAVRGREGQYERLLEYKNDFLWQPGCYKNFPAYVTWHMQANHP